VQFIAIETDAKEVDHLILQEQLLHLLMAWQWWNGGEGIPSRSSKNPNTGQAVPEEYWAEVTKTRASQSLLRSIARIARLEGQAGMVQPTARCS
jgi:hypothetical protein